MSEDVYITMKREEKERKEEARACSCNGLLCPKTTDKLFLYVTLG